MSMQVSFYLIAAAAVILTGISKSGFGGGLGVMATPLLTLFVEPQFAVAVLMPLLLAMDILVVWRFRRQWSWPVVATMLPGAFLGLAIGAICFEWMNADFIRLAVGLLALIFVVQFIWGRKLQGAEAKSSRAAVFVLGAASGFASFIAHAGGPPVKGFLLRQGFEKSVFVGTNTMFFFVQNFIKTVAYTALGHFSWAGLEISLYLSPLLFVGVFLGVLLHRFVNQRSFTSIVYVFLSFAGVKLLWDGAAGMSGGAFLSAG